MFNLFHSPCVVHIHHLRDFFVFCILTFPFVQVMDGERGNDYRRQLLPCYKAKRNKYKPLSGVRGPYYKGDEMDLREAFPQIQAFLAQCNVPVWWSCFLVVGLVWRDDMGVYVSGDVSSNWTCYFSMFEVLFSQTHNHFLSQVAAHVMAPYLVLVLNPLEPIKAMSSAPLHFCASWIDYSMPCGPGRCWKSKMQRQMMLWQP